jgi:hypothetical protein
VGRIGLSGKMDFGVVGEREERDVNMRIKAFGGEE